MDDARRAYWRTNLKYVGILLAIWFSVSLGAGVLFADALDTIPFFGFKLGFWFAQQGAIIAFVFLILIYALGMAWFDRQHRQELRRLRADDDEGAR